MIKIEFPADNKALAQAIGEALTKYAGAVQFYNSQEINKGLAEATERMQDAAAGVQEDVKLDTGSVESADGSSLPGNQDSVTHAETQSTTEPTGTSSDAGGADSKGVHFDPEFCGKAAEPFYKSGPRAGQWKKRKGVSDDDYDQWYADQFLGSKVQDGGDGEEDHTQYVGAAFGGSTETQTQEQPAAEGPKNPGELMVWVSERQNAGRLTAADVSAAWEQVGTPIHAVFAMAPEQQAGVVAAVHSILAAKAGA